MTTKAKKKAKKAAKKTEPCNCIKLVNEKLREQNAELDTSMAMNFETGKVRLVLTVPLRKINTKVRKPLPTMVCAYCPICGTNLRHKTKD